MDPAVKLAARSLNGCWTCRVRKKKCDETRPVCRSCNQFGLECHGYGPRPEWMDNGRLQKEQAARFKHIVSQRKSSTRKQCQAKEAQSSKDFTRCLEPVLTDDALTHMPSPSTSLCPTTSGCQDQFLDAILDSFVAPTWSTPPQNDYLPTAPQSPGNESAHQQLFRSIESPHSCSLPPRDNGEPSWCAPDVVGEHELACMSSAIVPQDNPGSSINRWSNTIVEEWAWDLPSANDPFPSQVPMSDDAAGTPTLAAHPINHQVGNSKATPDALTEAVRNDTTEEALFMHYLDRVFYIQYPFYLSCDRRGRGCLFSMLKIVKPAYFATLALSERDILFSHPQQCNATARPVPPCAKGRYHELAVRGTQRLLQESHTWSRSVQMIHVVESLTSILQLLFWELFAGGTGNWQALLRESARLIPTLLESRTPLTKQKVACAEYAGPQLQIEELLSDSHFAISHLLGSFISLDIISSASTRRPLFLNIDHAKALRDPCVSLEGIMGCRNSIMTLIYDISLLDRWKEESQADRKLSIIDLAERGRQIEKRLQQELVDRDVLPNTSPTLLNTSSSTLSGPANPVVNKLFALAALIYLHVVISGAHPELPEIAAAVAQAITVFKDMWDRRLLQSVLVWPFCVSGCLALGEQQAFFRNLLAAAEITEFTPGTCFEAFRIMEKCWEARSSGPSNYEYEWASIMKQHGCDVFLR